MRHESRALEFVYHFDMAEGRRETVSLRVALPDFVLEVAADAPRPDWTALEYHQCDNCPLNCRTTPHCPVALHLVGIGAKLGGLISYHRVGVEVETPERTVRTEADTQQAVRSLLGLVMAVSGCPHMDFFKPMARFHLPLATVEETLIRASSFYLLEQYFTKGKAGVWDLSFEGLAERYRAVQAVNKGISRRLREAEVFKELNWIAQLDALAQILPMAIDEHIDELAPLFRRDDEA